MADMLSPEALTETLTELDGWAGDTTAIRRDVAAPSFLAGIRLVDDVAAAAEEMNHHPDIDIRWRTVTFTLSSHDAGGVTDRDITLARRIDALASGLRAD